MGWTEGAWIDSSEGQVIQRRIHRPEVLGKHQELELMQREVRLDCDAEMAGEGSKVGRQVGIDLVGDLERFGLNDTVGKEETIPE
jgi:hypothetical protein